MGWPAACHRAAASTVPPPPLQAVSNGDPPTFVWSLFFILSFLYIMFAVNQALQFKQVGRPVAVVVVLVLVVALLPGGGERAGASLRLGRREPCGGKGPTQGAPGAGQRMRVMRSRRRLPCPCPRPPRCPRAAGAWLARVCPGGVVVHDSQPDQQAAAGLDHLW